MQERRLVMFDNLNNISDELLAAFLDGNTTKEETEQVLETMIFDENIMEVVDISTEFLEVDDISEIDEIDDLLDGLM